MWTIDKLFYTVLKIIALITIVIFFFKVRLYKQAVQKTLYSKNPQIKLQYNNSTSKRPNSQVLEHLEDITAVPLLGMFYEQQKMHQLLRLQRYEDTLQLINKALESPFRRKSFNLWYLKALSELQLNLLEEGQQSLAKMSMYAKKKYQNVLVNRLGDMLSKIRDIQNIQKQLQLQNGLKMSKKQLQKHFSDKDQTERENF